MLSNEDLLYIKIVVLKQIYSLPSVLGKLDVLESIADFAKADVVALQRPARTNLPRRSRRLAC